MLRLVTVDGKFTPKPIEDKRQKYIDLQEKVDAICSMSFRHRAYYLAGISDFEPFDPKRAKKIMEIMIEKGRTDPKAYTFGNILRDQCRDFIILAI